MSGSRRIGLRRAGIRGLLTVFCLTLPGCMYAEPGDSDIRRLEAKLPVVCGKSIAAYQRYYAYGLRSRDGESATVDLGTIDATFVLAARGSAHSYEIVRPPDLPDWTDKPDVVRLSFDRRTAVADVIVCADRRF